ncbi:hypothetical protein HY628_00805 [Candidatus Uhrbacteria bacterium]|nr:hypothetical protein [Candidatus Uhrbacteria bacterium]
MSSKPTGTFSLSILASRDGRRARIQLPDGFRVTVDLPDDQPPFHNEQDVMEALSRAHRITLNEYTWVAPGVYSANRFLSYWGQKVEAWHAKIWKAREAEIVRLFLILIRPFHIGVSHNRVDYQTPLPHEMEALIETVRTEIRTRQRPFEGRSGEKQPTRSFDLMGLAKHNTIMICGELTGGPVEKTGLNDRPIVQRLAERLMEAIAQSGVLMESNIVSATGFVSFEDLVELRTETGAQPGEVYSSQMRRLAAEAVERAEERLQTAIRAR